MDAQFKEAGLHYMATSARSMLDRLAGGQDELFVSGSDLRQALEVAAAVHLSAEAGGAPLSPLSEAGEGSLRDGGRLSEGSEISQVISDLP